MMTILIDHLSQAYTRRILHEQCKVQHLVQLDQSLLTRIAQQEDTLIFLSFESNAKRANVMSTRAALYLYDRMLSIDST